MIIISNNDKVIDFYKDLYETCFIEGTYGQVLEFARDKIHLGHKLLTHPLSGSVKPNETPFKSLAISQKTETLDFNSLEIIENAISTYTKFCKQGMRSDRMEYTESIIDDFKEVDFTLIKSAI